MKIPNFYRRANGVILKEEGFTLLELLIVIVIISLLSTFIMANFVGFRERARDGQRKADLMNIQSALETYKADQGSYPISPLPSCFDSPAQISSGTTLYLDKIPCDPMGENAYNLGDYYYTSDGNTYNLIACLENTKDQDPHAATGPQPGTGCESDYYYILYSQ